MYNITPASFTENLNTQRDKIFGLRHLFIVQKYLLQPNVASLVSVSVFFEQCCVSVHQDLVRWLQQLPRNPRGNHPRFESHKQSNQP
jgi:hypothetical protein